MNEKIKNIISIILPIITIFIIGIIFKTQPIGFVVYENRTLYRIDGSISVSLQEKIPADSYIRVRIDSYEIKTNLLEFLEMSGKDYRISDGFVIANDTFKVDFKALGIIEGFEEGRHIIKTEIIYENSILYSDKKIIEI